jgi:hypothetical protein
MATLVLLRSALENLPRPVAEHEQVVTTYRAVVTNRMQA